MNFIIDIIMDEDMSMTNLGETNTSPLFEPSVRKTDDMGYEAQRKALEEKNISIEQDTNKMDFSTPLDEVMDTQEVQAPNMIPQPGGMMPQQPTMQHPQSMMQQQKPAAPKQNPMNLTDEQMDALLVGAIAVMAFSKPIQEKVASLVPTSFSENGSRTMTGIVVTGLIAASGFYFGKRFIR